MTISVMTLGILAAGGWMFARSSLFALERIEVAGTKALSQGEVLRASGLTPGRNMLSLDLDAIEARVSRLPLVESVDVTKPAPSRVRILVKERTPAWVLETIYGLYHLDALAVVLGTTWTLDPTLPTIRSLNHGSLAAGDQIRSDDIADTLTLWESLPGSLRSGSPRIEVSDGSITMIRGGLTIRFGSSERMDEKIEAVRLVVERARAARERLSAIDVRSPSRPAAVPA